MSGRLPSQALVALLALVLAAACGGAGPEVPEGVADDGAVTVASFNFPESVLLAELYATALEAADVPVARQLSLGPREVVAPALEQGVVDLVPEYTGTALAFLSGDPEAAGPDADATARRLTETYRARGVEVRRPAAAESQNGFVVTQGTALAYGLRAVSELASVAGTMAIGGPPECPDRPFCLPGLERVYGLRFERFVPIDSGGRLTLAALRGGDVDVALLFTTDGALGSGGDLVLLEDDRSLQPAENIVPVVRTAALEAFGPRVGERLDAVSGALTTAELVELNRRVSAGGGSVGEVAADWLADEGLA